MFAIFINDLASEIKESNIGVNISESEIVNILLYADGYCVVSESDLQDLLVILEKWCQKWRLKISKRNTRSTRFLFHFISYVGNYEPTCIVTIKMVTM